MELISNADDVNQMIKTISEKEVEPDEAEGEDGEGEVVALARRSLELMGKGPTTTSSKSTLVEG